MKKALLIALACSAFAAGTEIGSAQSNLAQEPAYLPIDDVLDLKIAKPEVDVNLPRFLLMDVVSGLDLGTNSAMAEAGARLKDMIKDIKLIRVIVISGTEENQAHIDTAVESLQQRLETNWIRIVSVPEENVGVYAISDATGEAIGGLALLVHNDGETVIANIVGNVSIGKLIKLAANMNASGGMFPKDLIQKLIQSVNGATAASESSPSDTTTDSN